MPVPGKVDDIPKTAKSVHADDYHCDSYKIEVKQKTNLDGAIATAAVDLTKGKGSPATLTWKFPKPFGIVGFAIDKFELNPKSEMKLESSMKKELHGVDGLAIDAKCGKLDDLSSGTVGLTYTGIKDACIKFEAKPLKFETKTLTGECLYGTGPVVFGAKFVGLGVDTISASYTYSDFFAAVVASKNLTEYAGHGSYKLNPKLTLAGNFVKGAKGNSYILGLSSEVAGGVKLKAKMDSEGVLSAACKADVVKGFTLNAGGQYKTKDQSYTYGVKLNVE
jgi:hypothetical protein